MTRIVNTHQAEAWNGYEGSHWAQHQDRYNAVHDGFNKCLLTAAAIGETDRVLDIGCGAGQTTRLAARQAARGAAVGVDLSAPMLAEARRTTEREGIANATFEQGDAQVHPFPGAWFDVAVSRLGIMFFADPVAGFANIRRALRPGGRLAFVCPREREENDLGVVLAAMWQHLPTRTADHPDQPGPSSLADPARIRDTLTAAGFAQVTWTAVEVPQTWGIDVEDAAEFLGNWGPVRFHLDQADAAAADRARAALVTALRPHQQADAVRTRGTAWLVTATTQAEGDPSDPVRLRRAE